ncbi:hypothetical protein D3C80_1419600 [compost metagenome]
MNGFDHRTQVTGTLFLCRVAVQCIIQFIGIHQVEVTCHSQVSCRVNVRFYKWVTEGNIVTALCTVSQVTQHCFAHEAQVAFQHTRMCFQIRIHFFQLLYLVIHLVENLFNGSWSGYTQTVHILVSRLYI